jgi:hypothetical protein
MTLLGAVGLYRSRWDSHTVTTIDALASACFTVSRVKCIKVYVLVYVLVYLCMLLEYIFIYVYVYVCTLICMYMYVYVYAYLG